MSLPAIKEVVQHSTTVQTADTTAIAAAIIAIM